MIQRHNSGFVLMVFKILYNVRGQELHENYINGFPEKVIQGNGPFWAQK